MGVVAKPWTVLAALLGCTALCASADATPKRAWSGDLEAVTDFPIQLGAALRVEAPVGFQITTSIGVLPTEYVDVINAIATGTGAYEQETADLVSESLRESLVWRLHVGYRPLVNHGFYLEAGYGLVALGSLVRGTTIVGIPDPRFQALVASLEDLSGLDLDEVMAANRYRVDSLLHMVNAEVGYRFLFGGGWTARLALGGAFTAAGNTSISARASYVGQGWKEDYNEELMRETKRYLDGLYAKSVHTVVITFALGHRLF